MRGGSEPQLSRPSPGHTTTTTARPSVTGGSLSPVTSSGPSTPTALKQNGRHVVAVREESAWRPGVSGKCTFETLRNCQDSDPGRASAGPTALGKPPGAVLSFPPATGDSSALPPCCQQVSSARDEAGIPTAAPSHGYLVITTVITASGQSDSRSGRCVSDIKASILWGNR